jgi:hypothetical protein
MRTTLDIDDALLAEAKALAAREHMPLTRVIEQGLVLRLRRRPARSRAQAHALPVYAGVGGLASGVKDSVSNRALLDASGMENTA